MENINGRIAKIVEESKLTKTAFAKKLNVSQQYISKITKTGDPSDLFIGALCREFKVNENWLRTGDGDPYNKLPEALELGTYIGKILQSDDDFIKNIIINYMKLDEDSKKIVRDFVKSLGPSKPDI